MNTALPERNFDQREDTYCSVCARMTNHYSFNCPALRPIVVPRKGQVQSPSDLESAFRRVIR